MATLLYVGTHGPEDPTRACMPLHLAVASAEEGVAALVHLRGDAVTLVCRAAVDGTVPVGMPPLRDLLAQAREHAVPIFI